MATIRSLRDFVERAAMTVAVGSQRRSSVYFSQSEKSTY
jgi:hypothetical protein